MYGRMMNVKLGEGTAMPSYAHDGDAGLDLRIAENVALKRGGTTTVGLGIAVEIPHGCVGLLLPRSGLAVNDGVTLTNGVGVIDSGHRGELQAPLTNIGIHAAFLPKGTRVCQLVIVPFVPCILTQADELSDTERGCGGFGSTGIE